MTSMPRRPYFLAPMVFLTSNGTESEPEDFFCAASFLRFLLFLLGESLVVPLARTAKGAGCSTLFGGRPRGFVEGGPLLFEVFL